jgi:sugar lactone lactonase YvrE
LEPRYPEHGLLFSDMTQGGVYRLGISRARREVVVAHRKGVGGLVAHRDGGLVVTGRNVAQKAVDGTTTVVMQTAADELFFNDLTADRRGRLFVGSVGMNTASAVKDDVNLPCGRLCRVDLDGSVTVLADDACWCPTD